MDAFNVILPLFVQNALKMIFIWIQQTIIVNNVQTLYQIV